MKPVASAAPVGVSGDLTTGTGSAAANRAALSSTAEQTARITRDRDQNARNLAAFAEAQAAYAREVKSYEAAKTAAARKAADEAAAYQLQLAAWRTGADRHKQPAPKAAAAAAGAASRPAARRRCGFETPTGSNIPVRVCH